MKQKNLLSEKEKRKTVGTLFDEDEQEMKQHFYNQQGRDNKNHKKWHGAFTGGFTAGYNNTVGSKEGWTPKQFISSRDSRAQVKETKIIDLLDEDELAELKMTEISKKMNLPTQKIDNHIVELETDINYDVGEIVLQNLIKNANAEEFLKRKWDALLPVLQKRSILEGLPGLGDSFQKNGAFPQQEIKSNQKDVIYMNFTSKENPKTSLDDISDTNLPVFKTKLIDDTRNIQAFTEGKAFHVDEPLSEEVQIQTDYNFYRHEQTDVKTIDESQILTNRSTFIEKYKILTGSNLGLNDKFSAQTVLAPEQTNKEIDPKLKSQQKITRSISNWDVKEQLANKFGLTTLSYRENEDDEG